MDKKSKISRFIIKTIINFIVFSLLFGVLIFTKLPSKFDTYIYYKDFKLDAWLWLITYRFIVYFAYPFIPSIIELKKKNRGGIGFKFLLLENFNVQFFTYTIISAVYTMFGLDKVLKTDIFGSSDAFMFIGGFIFTLVLNNDIPNLFYETAKLYDGDANYKLLGNIDINSIKHDYDPEKKTRSYLSFEYNDIKEGNELIVVMKNPSQSFSNSETIEYDKKCIDLSTRNVMKFVDIYNKNNPTRAYKKVTIFNLFPNYATDNSVLNSIYGFKVYKSIKPNLSEYKNAHKIIKTMVNSQDVIFAWGDNSDIYKGSYDLAIEDMKEHFITNKKLEFVNGDFVENTQKYPLHPRVWRIHND